jgi:hypothetical protein
MFTNKGAYRYSNGLWTMETEGMSAWLNVEIENAAKRYRQPSSIKLITRRALGFNGKNKSSAITTTSNGMRTGSFRPRAGWSTREPD